jgi:hypothetical protein
MEEGPGGLKKRNIRVRSKSESNNILDPEPLVRGTDPDRDSGSGYFHHQAKLVRKTFIFTV